VCVRWDISDPQAVVGRLQELPGQGSMTRTGRKLFAERDGFGKWQHLLGPRHSLITYTHAPPSKENILIRRLEVQAHLGPEGEDDLCSVESFGPRWHDLEKRMAVMGVLPATMPRVVRIDPAVDVVYDDPQDGYRSLEALRFARWPRSWYAEWQGPPPYTTVAIKSGTRTIGRAYCRNKKLKNGEPVWGKIRYEAEHRSQWPQGLPVEHLESPAAPEIYWGWVFGEGQASGKVTRLKSEVVAVNLIEKVVLGEIGYAQFERMNAYLTAERLGLVHRAYTPEQARTRRREAKELGLSAVDAEYLDPCEFDESLDEVLAVPRSAWASVA
jgi:hypothetical protein